jgi:hypothetical protein
MIITLKGFADSEPQRWVLATFEAPPISAEAHRES